MADDKKKPQLRKGDKFFCEGCKRENAAYESGGLCGVCNAKRRKERLAAKAAVQQVKPVIKAAVVYPELEDEVSLVAPASFGKVENVVGDSVGFGVDPLVQMAMRDAWYEAERKALVALSGLSPASALVRAAGFVQRLQGLEV